jgi:hypothetical protein
MPAKDYTCPECGDHYRTEERSPICPKCSAQKGEKVYLEED